MRCEYHGANTVLSSQGYGFQYKTRNSGSVDHYDALNPIPQNYTMTHMLSPTKKRSEDFDERQAVALSDAVIKEVKAKYSVSAVRALYRRRRETEEYDQKAAYQRSKKMMQAEKRVMEWKKTRVIDARSKKTATVDEVAKDVKKVKEEDDDDDGEKEPEYFVLEGLTLVKMSTDPFYKSNLETDARAALRARKR